MSFYQEMSNMDKATLDVISVGTVVATMTDFLPAFAAILTIVWTGIRIYETDTVQAILGRKPNGEKPDAE